MNRTLVIAVLFSTTPACAFDYETAIEEAAFQTVHLIDTGQTLDTRMMHGRVHESSDVFDAGWIIGPHPADKDVWRYMGAEAALHASVTYALVRLRAPRWALRTWEVVTIGVDTATISRNASLGLNIRF